MKDEIRATIDNIYVSIKRYEDFKRQKIEDLSPEEVSNMTDQLIQVEKELNETTLKKIEANASKFWRTGFQEPFIEKSILNCLEMAIDKHILRTLDQIKAEHPTLPKRIQDMLEITEEACQQILHCEMTFQLGTHKTLLKWTKELTLSEYKTLARQKLDYARRCNTPNEELWNVIAGGLYHVKNKKYTIII